MHYIEGNTKQLEQQLKAETTEITELKTQLDESKEELDKVKQEWNREQEEHVTTVRVLAQIIILYCCNSQP